MTEGLRVNISDKEAAAKSGGLVLPRGWYHVAITDLDLRESQSDKNKGKPYWNVEFTVQEGEYEGKNTWTNVMLFEGALYSLVNMMKALGYDVTQGTFTVPDPEEIIGQDLEIRLIIKPETDEYDARNEVKGWRSYDRKADSKSNSLLP